MSIVRIRKLRLSYKTDTEVLLPKRLQILGLAVVPDQHDKNNIPFLTYIDKGEEKELKTLRLVSGEAELDTTHHVYDFLAGPIPLQKRHHPNFANLFLVTKRKSHPDNNPPAPKKVQKKVNPESQKAIAAEKERKELLGDHA